MVRQFNMSRAGHSDRQIVTKIEIYIVIQSEDLTTRQSQYPMVNNWTVRYSDSQAITKLDSVTFEQGKKSGNKINRKSKF